MRRVRERVQVRQLRQIIAHQRDIRRLDGRIGARRAHCVATVAVDVVRTDELLDERVLGAVHERPDADAVEALRAAAEMADARPVLVTTAGALDTDVAAIIDADEIRVLRPDGDGLAPSYDVVGEHEAPTVFQRLTSGVTERLQ